MKAVYHIVSTVEQIFFGTRQLILLFYGGEQGPFAPSEERIAMGVPAH